MEHLNTYYTFFPNSLSQRREGAKLLLVILSLYFQDSYHEYAGSAEFTNYALTFAPLRLCESFFLNNPIAEKK